MPKLRTISKNPPSKNFYIVDANFLANKYIPLHRINNSREKLMVEKSQEWWREIDAQIRTHKALVYIPDVCIAEAFKVLAKKYYRDKYFLRAHEYVAARARLSKFIHIDPRTLKGSDRKIKVHDISTSRDIIIAVDRFYEFFAKKNLDVSIPDLIILATAKYVIDFFNVPMESLFIVTLDTNLWKGTKKLADVPSAFNPIKPSEASSRVFR